MYEIDDKDAYYMSLPPNLQDVDARCFSYALAKQMKKFIKLAERLNLWGDLEHANPKHYDYIAACMRVPYYRSDFSDTIKLQLIKHAYEMYRYAGTRKGIEDLIGIVFEKAIYKSWDEYEGKQYHFKILAYDVLTEDLTTVFANVLQKVKAARSVMDTIEVGRESFGLARPGAATHADIKQASITEDNSGENTCNLTSCTGATTYANVKQAYIQEDNSLSNTAVQIVQAAAGKKEYAARVEQEDNSLANSAGTDVHAGGASYDEGQTNGTISEDNSLENQAEKTVYIAADSVGSAENIRII